MVRKGTVGGRVDLDKFCSTYNNHDFVVDSVVPYGSSIAVSHS